MRTVREITQAEFEREAKETEFVNHLCKALALFEGKQVTKRLSNAVKKMYEDENPGNVPHVCLLPIGSSFTNIQIWHDNDYENRHTYLVCYHSDPVFRMEKFREHNPAFFAGADKRQAQRKALLESDTPEIIQGKIDAVLKAEQELKEVFEYYTSNIPDFFDIERENHLRKERER